MNPKAWMDYMFDHTMLVAEDDPYVESFKKMNEVGVAQVRILPAVGAEKFAEYLYQKLSPFINEETQGRVRIMKIEVYEHERNSATYVP
jgi:6-pyruvoyltetrahydropterin/6-carboxytetrahydropterin synthase